MGRVQDEGGPVLAGKVCRVRQGCWNVTLTLVAGDGGGSAVVAMESDVKGQEDRHPVYLPENRYHWASNDEVDKPTVILRGPVRPRFKRPTSDISSNFDLNDWLRKKLPRASASLIVSIVIASVILATYSELAVLLSR